MAHIIHHVLLVLIGLNKVSIGAVLPPPWANPKLNPCATQPGGWQLLYWPPDGKCYKIFQLGHPCPEDMELSPAPTRKGENTFSAECRCPPMKAQFARDSKCYDLYSSGPCDIGYYFAPDLTYNNTNSAQRQWGVCAQVPSCTHPNEVFWPRDGRCYPKNTKGPCSKGQLIAPTPHRLGHCSCEQSSELSEFRHSDGKCYQHFSRGPCKEPGHLFLPDRTCGCHRSLPHFDPASESCYELSSIGPCNSGEHFQLHAEAQHGACQCKPGYIRYLNSTQCYRPFTEGPCGPTNILVNSTSCIRQPCARGHLFFATLNRCYRIGSRGPCRRGRIVTFDFKTRPSLDGISFNGLCSCEKYVYSNNCDQVDVIQCDISEGMVFSHKRCYKLYAQGPCPKGAWLVPNRQTHHELWTKSTRNKNEGVCECVPGYTKTRSVSGDNNLNCMSPTVILANFLNRNITAAFVTIQKTV